MKRRKSWGCQKNCHEITQKIGCVNRPLKDKRNLDSICLKAKIRVNSLDGFKSGVCMRHPRERTKLQSKYSVVNRTEAVLCYKHSE